MILMKMNPHIRDLNEAPVERSVVKQAEKTNSTRYELTQYSHRELIELVLAKDIVIRELESGFFTDEYFGESKEVAND